MKIEELFPGVKVEVLPAPGACSTCGGKGEIPTKKRPPTVEMIGDAYGSLRSIKATVPTRLCPHCWGYGRGWGR